ncbi:YcaO-like family protein [Roseibium sp.]|uniref:YcaO-like family protein n=1 Tax=Roseibium sp. TaxID=1936156 RepID=UPI003BA888C2
MAGKVPTEIELPDHCWSDLVRSGLASRAGDASGSGRFHVEPDLGLFLPLLSRFDVRLAPMHVRGCPVKFCTGTIKLARDPAMRRSAAATTIPAGGQSDTSSGAALSCLGELSERLSLCSLGEQDSRVEIDLTLQSQIEMAKVLGFSARQLRGVARQVGRQVEGAGPDVPDLEQFSARTVNVRRLGDGMPASCPSAGVLFGEFELITGRPGGFASTVGAAVWRDRDGARKRALLELVERDAVAQAWYNRLGITRIKIGFVSSVLPQQVAAHLDESRRFWGLYSVATDLQVHIALAVSCEADGRRTAFGSAAGWDLASACKSAVTEMLQSKNALDLMERAYGPQGAGSREPQKLPKHLSYARDRSVFDDFLLKADGSSAPPDPETVFTYDDLLDSCTAKGIAIWEFDATRSDLGIPCIKLISPELCSWEPRFGKDRLFQGVVERGLRAHPAAESEFESRPFPF